MSDFVETRQDGLWDPTVTFSSISRTSFLRVDYGKASSNSTRLEKTDSRMGERVPFRYVYSHVTALGLMRKVVMSFTAGI